MEAAFAWSSHGNSSEGGRKVHLIVDDVIMCGVLGQHPHLLFAHGDPTGLRQLLDQPDPDGEMCGSCRRIGEGRLRG